MTGTVTPRLYCFISCLICCLVGCLSPFATTLHAEKQEFTFDDTKSIVVKVSETGLTRLSVQGDRLREVIGLDETVSIEKDEANGHLFLKGVKTKQTITIVTEGGALQDLTLIPSAKGSTTILLKNEPNSKGDALNPEPFSFTSMGASSYTNDPLFSKPTLVDALIMFIKHLVAGGGKPCEHSTTRKALGDIKAVLTHQLHSQSGVGEVFCVTNTRDSAMALCEKDFYQPGDLALAFNKGELEPGETAMLYVVRSRGPSNVA